MLLGTRTADNEESYGEEGKKRVTYGGEGGLHILDHVWRRVCVVSTCAKDFSPDVAC